MLIGAAVLAATALLGGSIAWAFMQIPNYPYAMAIVVFILLSWGIGMVATDNMK
jgi:hypothetical protein